MLRFRKPPSQKQCIEAVRNSKRKGIARRFVGIDVISSDRHGFPIWANDFQLSGPSEGESKTLLFKGKLSYRPYLRENVNAEAMRHIQKAEPLEGFKSIKVRPQLKGLNPYKQEVRVTDKEFEKECEDFGDAYQISSDLKKEIRELWES